jgi:hypothetical protein
MSQNHKYYRIRLKQPVDRTDVNFKGSVQQELPNSRLLTTNKVYIWPTELRLTEAYEGPVSLTANTK